jgi:hypothetical protein
MSSVKKLNFRLFSVHILLLHINSAMAGIQILDVLGTD